MELVQHCFPLAVRSRIIAVSWSPSALTSGEMSAPAFNASTRDEIGRLAASFTRMRKSMVQALRLLERETVSV